MKRQKVVAVAGMPGAGKGLVSSIAQSRRIPVFVCGDVVREETERRGFPTTPENMGRVMLSIRHEEGPGVVAERLIPRIASSALGIVVVEGVRSMDEVKVLIQDYTVTILAVHASPRTRYERLARRGRSDDPKSWEEFVERDSRELSVGIGNVIALAERMLVNEGSEDEFNEAAEAAISRVTQE
jgi:dephospho-CoA kinase